VFIVVVFLLLVTWLLTQHLSKNNNNNLPWYKFCPSVLDTTVLVSDFMLEIQWASLCFTLAHTAQNTLLLVAHKLPIWFPEKLEYLEN